MPLQADICVLGGGPGGYVAALRASARGAKVALVESDDVGGVCLNRGCIPSKTLLRSAEVYQLALHGSSYGVETTGVRAGLRGDEQAHGRRRAAAAEGRCVVAGRRRRDGAQRARARDGRRSGRGRARGPHRVDRGAEDLPGDWLVGRDATDPRRGPPGRDRQRWRVPSDRPAGAHPDRGRRRRGRGVGHVVRAARQRGDAGRNAPGGGSRRRRGREHDDAPDPGAAGRARAYGHPDHRHRQRRRGPADRAGRRAAIRRASPPRTR